MVKASNTPLQTLQGLGEIQLLKKEMQFQEYAKTKVKKKLAFEALSKKLHEKKGLS